MLVCYQQESAHFKVLQVSLILRHIAVLIHTG